MCILHEAWHLSDAFHSRLNRTQAHAALFPSIGCVCVCVCFLFHSLSCQFNRKRLVIYRYRKLSYWNKSQSKTKLNKNKAEKVQRINRGKSSWKYLIFFLLLWLCVFVRSRSVWAAYTLRVVYSDGAMNLFNILFIHFFVSVWWPLSVVSL